MIFIEGDFKIKFQNRNVIQNTIFILVGIKNAFEIDLGEKVKTIKVKNKNKYGYKLIFIISSYEKILKLFLLDSFLFSLCFFK